MVRFESAGGRKFEVHEKERKLQAEASSEFGNGFSSVANDTTTSSSPPPSSAAIKRCGKVISDSSVIAVAASFALKKRKRNLIFSTISHAINWIYQ